MLQLVAASLFLAGCGAPATGPAARDSTLGRTATKDEAMSQTDDSIARRFGSLDAYLAWLEQNEGPAGGAWYKQVGPDLYELQTGNLHLDGPDAGKTTFTRAELEARFGFTR